jgi:hypothetical protein
LTEITRPVHINTIHLSSAAAAAAPSGDGGVASGQHRSGPLAFSLSEDRANDGNEGVLLKEEEILPPHLEIDVVVVSSLFPDCSWRKRK